MLEAFEYAFFRNAFFAGLLASIACGIIGTYIVVKRISSISGALSHAAFGGVGLGYFFGFNPILGAALFGIASSVGVGIFYRKESSHLDTLLSMFWSVGMAVGIVFIALTPGYAPDLLSYLFGSILFVPEKFLLIAGLLDVVILVAVFLLYKEFQAVAFDEEFAEVIGLPVGIILHILLVLIALAVVTLIRIVGVILVIALLTFPAAIARHWCEKLGRMMLLASVLSAVVTTAGLFISLWLSQTLNVQLPTGPLIILVAALLYVASTVIHSRKTVRQPIKKRSSQ